MTTSGRPIEVAVIGGGCAAVTAAFELTQPHHEGRFAVTVYQQGWRLGGKGASGRGKAGRIEEHGLHIWLGFYENAFALMRAAYEELGRDPKTHPIATWRDAFFPMPHVGIADRLATGRWDEWMAHFPPTPGLPGDPLRSESPFTLASYVAQTVSLLRTLLFDARTRGTPDGEPASVAALVERAARLVAAGALSVAAALSEALGVLTVALREFPAFPEALISRLIEDVAVAVREQLAGVVDLDPDVRRKWDVIDLAVSFLVGVVRHRLLSDPEGLSAIDRYDVREFLGANGASERTLQSGFVRALYDLPLAYEDGDPARPGLAAGQALRGALRMFFTYRGALFWKMRAGMGDIVFAPLYEVLKRRGVRFEFFHRLENIKLPQRLASGERPYVEALEFDVQAEVEGEYRPLVDVNGVPCWPSEPDFSQLVGGETLKAEGRRFESHWDRRRARAKTLHVTKDFDFVVLGVSVGAMPFVAREILERDPRWRAMVENVKTVASQAFQIWLDRDAADLGWTDPPIVLSGFVKPFDTWADMTHLSPQESWRVAPRHIAYFCNVLEDRGDPDAPDYEAAMREAVRENAVRFLKRDMHELWPKAATPGAFRFDWLIDPEGEGAQGEARFASQFWTANVNPSDRYVLMLPGTLRYRISPLDNTYDNLTLAGDWTDCGYNAGCVEAAVMSGRLAAHALSGTPRLEDIVGYDHP